MRFEKCVLITNERCGVLTDSRRRVPSNVIFGGAEIDKTNRFERVHGFNRSRDAITIWSRNIREGYGRGYT